MKSIFQQLVDACLPSIEAYQTDLLTVDREMIEANPGVPFLHWTRSTGTWISFLYPADHPRYPPKGVEIKYLFGLADREHIARQVQELAQGIVKNSNTLLTFHFDGHKLHRINDEAALKIARDYVRRTLEQFRNEELICV